MRLFCYAIMIMDHAGLSRGMQDHHHGGELVGRHVGRICRNAGGMVSGFC